MYRPRVPRETRRLLITAVLALGTIWALARIRFLEPVTPNPVAPLLTQLGTPYRLSDIAREIAEARDRLSPWIAPQTFGGRPVLRLRGEIGLVPLPRDEGSRAGYEAASESSGYTLLARDPATGLGVVRIPDRALRAPPVPWTPERERPLHLFAASLDGGRVSATPALVEVLDDAADAAWPGSVWRLRAGQPIDNGTFLFGESGALAGLAILTGGSVAIVPAATLVEEADRLLREPPGARGWLGVEAVPMTPALAAATGGTTGAVVSAVDPDGPAAGRVMVGDVVIAIDGAPIRSVFEWRARAVRTAAGRTVTLQLARGGDAATVDLVAGPMPAASSDLGLDLRAVREGAEITAVARGSAAWRSGLREGDRIHQIGGVTAPTPVAVRRAYASLAEGGAVVVGLTRDGTAQVIGLEKHAAR